MSGDDQVFKNFSEEIVQSRAVQFFQSTPRWPTASTDFQFTVEYLRPVAFTAILPLFFAVFVIFILAIAIVVRYTCLSTQILNRLRLQYESQRATLALVPISAVLLTAIFIFTSIGLLGNATLNHSSNDALDVFTALVNDLSRSGFVVADTAILLKSRLEQFNPDSTTGNNSILPELVGDLVTPTLLASKRFVLSRYPDVSPLRSALQDLRDSLLDVFNSVRRLVGLVYIVLLITIAALLIAIPALRVVTARSTKPWVSVAAYIVCLFVPTLVAWVLVGVLSAVGAVVADVCVSISEYRDVLRNVTSEFELRNNSFVKSGFTCPDGMSAEELEHKIGSTAVSVLQSDLARSTIQLLLSTPPERIAETADWTSKQLPRYLDCSAQVIFTGKLEFVACGRDGLSAIDGIWNLWSCFIGLAICLSIAMLASLLGVHVMRFLDVWPYISDDESDIDRRDGTSRVSNDQVSVPPKQNVFPGDIDEHATTGMKSAVDED